MNPARIISLKHAALAGGLLGLYATSLHSYPLFHTLAELCSIVIAYGVFMMALPARRFTENDYFLFLGFAYFSVGSLDLMHTLSYKGVGIFHGDEANLATQLWIAARYVESVALLVAPSFLDRRFHAGRIGAVFFLVTALFLTIIFGFKAFPVCYVEGRGLTPFKKASEYIICALLILSIVRTYKKRDLMNPLLFRMIAASIILTVLAELAFTFYIGVYDISNMAGHYLKLASFYLIYRGVIAHGLSDPYTVLFNNLKTSETTLAAQNRKLAWEIERRARTELQLKKINQELRSAKQTAEQGLDEARRKKEDLVVRVSELTMKKSDILQQNAKLLRTVEALRSQNEILNAQLSDYVRIVEQAHEDIDELVADG